MRVYMNFEKRKDTLKKMASYLREERFANKLISAYMKDTGFLRNDIYAREIEFPLFLMDNIGEETEYTRNFGLEFDSIRPLGKVVVILPKNGINLLISKAVCSSFLGGNETYVKLPGKLVNSANLFKQLIEDCLPGVHVVNTEKRADVFLKECIESKEIKGIVIYGDDKWIWSYKNAIRATEKKLIFEGPGNDPQIVMSDADLSLAVCDAVNCGLLNGGQSCSAIERFFVHASILDEFIEKLVDKVSLLKIGRPDDEGSDIGPIYSHNVLARLIEQVNGAVEGGAKVVTGGKAIAVADTGQYAFQPTIIRNCREDMKVVQQENFGPVFPILSFSSEEELLKKLDDTEYGLNASIYGSCSEEIAVYLHKSHRNVYFNSTVTSSCNRESRMLDGGYKNSGFIWEWKNSKFLQAEGRRLLLKELSV
jgi:acyl-CoA reductase-like NAD-dependent aldehyde dehydrogenase